MNRENIENLAELLAEKVGTKKIATVKISKLTAPGDNYGGLLLRVDVTLEDSEGTIEDFHAVAKCIPVNTFMQRLFDIQVTVKKEIAFYDTVVPLLRQFQLEQGIEDVIDTFPELYAGRLNVNGSDIVDENSVILMENLIESGYKNVDRMVGFDLETTKVILKDLAIFHSTFIAFKLTKPDTFEEKMLPYFTPRQRPEPSKIFENGGAPVSSPMDMLKEFLPSLEEIRPILPKLNDILEFHPGKFAIPAPGTFFSASHGDLWVNNIMVKFEKEKPVGTKFVDFQNMEMGSSVIDLLFFLMSSVQQRTLDEHLDDLIKLYHEIFVENLIRHKCDPTPFSLDELLKEIKTNVKRALGQAMFMGTFVIFSEGNQRISEDDPLAMPNFGKVEDITPQARERISFLVNKCNKKGWL